MCLFYDGLIRRSDAPYHLYEATKGSYVRFILELPCLICSQVVNLSLCVCVCVCVCVRAYQHVIVFFHSTVQEKVPSIKRPYEPINVCVLPANTTVKQFCVAEL